MQASEARSFFGLQNLQRIEESFPLKKTKEVEAVLGREETVEVAVEKGDDREARLERELDAIEARLKAL